MLCGAGLWAILRLLQGRRRGAAAPDDEQPVDWAAFERAAYGAWCAHNAGGRWNMPGL